MTASVDDDVVGRQEVADAWLDRLAARYAQRRPRSAALSAESAAVLPGGNSRTPLFHAPFPTYMASGEGAEIIDVDGLRYVDLVNNYTSLVHGHPSPGLARLLADQAAAGTAFGAPTEVEVELARVLVERIPSVERVRFVNSGTEATLYAVRTARAFTGREDVIKVEGGYHGGAESLQVSVKTLGAVNEAVAEAGVPGAVSASTHVLPFNDVVGAERILRERAGRAAAVIVEPVQGGAGALPAEAEYLTMVREVTRELGCLLVFDEVMTLRLAYGGMQEAYGVEPDLTALGKVIGGGLPVGAFGGRAEIMDLWDPKTPGAPYHAGTFNANPLTAVAGLHGLRELTRERIDAINRRGELLRREFDRLAASHGVAMVASGWGSVLQVHEGHQAPTSFRDARSRRRELVRGFHLLMLDNGVFLAPRGAMNVSTAIAEQAYGHVIDAMDDALAMIARSGPSVPH